MSKDTLHESAQLLKGTERARIGSDRKSGRSATLASSRSSGTTCGQENSKGKGIGPDQSHGQGCVFVIGQEGLFNFPQLDCVKPTQWQHDYWNANEVDNCGEGNWPGRLAELCKTKKIEKMEIASQFAEAATQTHRAKKRQKVSWKRLDCQDELQKSMTHNKFATLTREEEEEQEFGEEIPSIGGNCSFALNTAVQETRAKRKVNTKKNIDMLVKVRESLVGGCAKNSSDAKSAWRRVSIAIDSGSCDSVISPEHVPDHEEQESEESWRGENFQSATGEPILSLGDLQLPLYMMEGTVRGMVMTASSVTKPLGFVKKVCQAGHTVVFDDEEPFHHEPEHWIGKLAERRGWKLHVGRVDTTSTARIQQDKFSLAAVTKKIGVSLKYRHNRVGAVGEEGVEDQEDMAAEAGPPGEPSICSEPQENAPLKVARDPGDPTTEERDGHNATHVPFRS